MARNRWHRASSSAASASCIHQNPIFNPRSDINCAVSDEIHVATNSIAALIATWWKKCAAGKGKFQVVLLTCLPSALSCMVERVHKVQITMCCFLMCRASCQAVRSCRRGTGSMLSCCSTTKATGQKYMGTFLSFFGRACASKGRKRQNQKAGVVSTKHTPLPPPHFSVNLKS